MKTITIITSVLLIGLSSLNSYSQIASIQTSNTIRAYAPEKRAKKYFKVEKVDYSEWKILLQKNVSATGKVNYKGFNNDIKKLNSFLRVLSTTKIAPNWTRKDKIAYWINVYNAYTVKLVLNHYPVRSIKDIGSPWKKSFFSINSKEMSLAMVEHEILRKFNEPRIHFAINCASASCPRLIQVPYDSENLERLLERQTTEFINDPFYNTITTYTVNVSKLFDWYKSDFKKAAGSATSFINRYSTVSIGDQKNKGYKEYDWSINAGE